MANVSAVTKATPFALRVFGSYEQSFTVHVLIVIVDSEDMTALSPRGLTQYYAYVLNAVQVCMHDNYTCTCD